MRRTWYSQLKYVKSDFILVSWPLCLRKAACERLKCSVHGSVVVLAAHFWLRLISGFSEAVSKPWNEILLLTRAMCKNTEDGLTFILMLVKSLGGFPAPSLKWCFDFCFINCAIFVNLSLLLWGDSNDCLGPQITLKFISILALVWKKKIFSLTCFSFRPVVDGILFLFDFCLEATQPRIQSLMRFIPELKKV